MEEKIKKNNKYNVLNLILKIVIFCILFILLSYISVHIILGEYLKDFVWEQKEITNEEQYYINDKSRIGGMVATGDGGISVTPIDAYIQNGVIYVEAKLDNSTGKNLEIRDFGKVIANSTTVPYATDFDGTKTLNNNSSINITFSFGAYDVMQNNKDYPTTILFEVGANSNNNYYEYDILFTIGWRYNSYYY